MAFAVRYAYGLLLPHMLSSLAISKTQAGFIYSSYFIAYTIFSPILGLLVDRYDARVLGAKSHRRTMARAVANAVTAYLTK